MANRILEVRREQLALLDDLAISEEGHQGGNARLQPDQSLQQSILQQ